MEAVKQEGQHARPGVLIFIDNEKELQFFTAGIQNTDNNNLLSAGVNIQPPESRIN